MSLLWANAEDFLPPKPKPFSKWYRRLTITVFLYAIGLVIVQGAEISDLRGQEKFWMRLAFNYAERRIKERALPYRFCRPDDDQLNNPGWMVCEERRSDYPEAH